MQCLWAIILKQGKYEAACNETQEIRGHVNVIEQRPISKAFHLSKCMENLNSIIDTMVPGGQ